MTKQQVIWKEVEQNLLEGFPKKGEEFFYRFRICKKFPTQAEFQEIVDVFKIKDRIPQVRSFESNLFGKVHEIKTEMDWKGNSIETKVYVFSWNEKCYMISIFEEKELQSKFDFGVALKKE